MTKAYSLFVFLLSFILLLLGVSCKEEGTVVLQEPTESSKQYKFKETEFFELSNEGENIVESWSVYNELERSLKKLPKSKLEDLRIESSKLVRYADSLSTNLPAQIDIMMIQARLDVVLTRFNLLKQSAEAIIVDSLALHMNYDESVLAFNALLHQIEEKIQKDKILKQEERNFEAELNQRHRDSIFRLELQREEREIRELK